MVEKSTASTRVAPENTLDKQIFVAVMAALAAKGTPADEAAELAKGYAIAGAAQY